MKKQFLYMISGNIKLIMDMPWVALNEIRRIISIPLLWFLFRIQGIHWGQGWFIYGMPIIQRYRGSTIQIGDCAALRSWPSSNPLVPYHPVVFATRSPNAMIRIGKNVGLSATTIVAAELIDIGERVTIGANTTIIDTDFHPLDYISRRNGISTGKHAPVVIEDDVFIGLNCLIMKGVHIGKGAVIGGGSVVTKDVPPEVIVAGNPARMIRNLYNL